MIELFTQVSSAETKRGNPILNFDYGAENESPAGLGKSWKNMARPEGFEPPTFWFVAGCKRIMKFVDSCSWFLLSIASAVACLALLVERCGSFGILHLQNQLK